MKHIPNPSFRPVEQSELHDSDTDDKDEHQCDQEGIHLDPTLVFVYLNPIM